MGGIYEGSLISLAYGLKSSLSLPQLLLMRFLTQSPTPELRNQ